MHMRFITSYLVNVNKYEHLGLNDTGKTSSTNWNKKITRETRT